MIVRCGGNLRRPEGTASLSCNRRVTSTLTFTCVTAFQALEVIDLCMLSLLSRALQYLVKIMGSQGRFYSGYQISHGEMAGNSASANVGSAGVRKQ